MYYAKCCDVLSNCGQHDIRAQTLELYRLDSIAGTTTSCVTLGKITETLCASIFSSAQWLHVHSRVVMKIQWVNFIKHSEWCLVHSKQYKINKNTRRGEHLTRRCGEGEYLKNIPEQVTCKLRPKRWNDQPLQRSGNKIRQRDSQTERRCGCLEGWAVIGQVWETRLRN